VAGKRLGKCSDNGTAKETTFLESSVSGSVAGKRLGRYSDNGTAKEIAFLEMAPSDEQTVDSSSECASSGDCFIRQTAPGSFSGVGGIVSIARKKENKLLEGSD
jgi:hypothetical protein